MAPATRKQKEHKRTGPGTRLSSTVTHHIHLLPPTKSHFLTVHSPLFSSIVDSIDVLSPSINVLLQMTLRLLRIKSSCLGAPALPCRQNSNSKWLLAQTGKSPLTQFRSVVVSSVERPASDTQVWLKPFPLRGQNWDQSIVAECLSNCWMLSSLPYAS